jgi:hypothetical protein
MKLFITCLLTSLLFGTGLAWGATDIRQKQVQFKERQTATTIRGKIKGRQIVDYRVEARAGQTLTVAFEPTNLAAYFNVLPPDSETALFIGSTTGNRFESVLPADGLYTIRVYLMRSAARRKETARYTLAVRLDGREKPAAAPGADTPFTKTLELQGIRFRITSTHEGSLNRLTIVPSGLEIVHTPIERTIDGTVTGAEVADLNADGSPEVYVYVTSTGSGSYGSLVAYSANRRTSLSEIYLPPLTADQKISHGYMGHDEFAVLEGVLGRRFPLYRDSDSNARPTGGMRQIQYKLVPGEAGWLLKVDRVVDY